jgi:secreted trypsin-like serine protease
MRELLLSTMLLTAGCAGDLSDLELLEGSGSQPESKIYGGSAPDAPEHDAVIALHELTRGGKYVYASPFCSGTLIREDVVITAAHCTTGMRANGLAIYVGDDPSADLVSHLYSVTEIWVHPGYDSRRITNDISLVRLATPVTEPVTPVAELASSMGLSSADLGATVNFAGFGQTEYGTSGVKLQVDGTIDALGCGVSGCPSPGDTATQFSYSQPTTGPCFGDSGGPAFIYRAGVPYVAGLTSYGDSTCSVYGVSTRVDAFEADILAFTGEGGGGGGDTGSVEPPPSGDCGNGTCDAGESCDGRSGTTLCEADCDGKTNGKPATRWCEVGDTCEGPACP